MPSRLFPDRFGRILALSLTCGSLAMIAAVGWYYTVQKRETEAATLRGVFAVAEEKTIQINNWRRERLGDGHAAMSSTIMRGAARILSKRPAPTDERDLLEFVRRLAEAFLYTDATLVDMDGNVLLRLHTDVTESAELRQPNRRVLAHQAVTAGDVSLSDLSLDTRTGKPLMWLTIPVEGLGALILDIDPARFLYPYVEAWPSSSRTAESVLIRVEKREIVWLSKRRHAPNAPLFERVALPSGVPPDRVVAAGWSFDLPDYRGVRVIGTARQVPDSPWFLVCKIDLAEVDEPLRRLGWEMALLAALVALANASGVALIWRSKQERVHRDREAWLAAVANDTPAYLWMASSSAENSFINRPLRIFLGAAEDALSNNWTEYLHPDDLEAVRARFQKAVAEAKPYSGEFRIRRFDGEYRTVVSQAVPRFSRDGKLLGFAGSIVDITGRRRAEEELQKANASLQAELAGSIRKEQEIRTLSARLIEAREDERKRLARELHDDLNQQIAGVSIAMGNLKRHIPAEHSDARAQSDRIHQKLVQLAESVRRMSHELHPAVLEYQGLAPALRTFCGEFGVLTGIRVTVDTDGEFDDVPQAVALCVYRIAQEALQNVAKHARVDSATVRLVRTDGQLRLTVSDSGVGIEAASGSGPGLGLASMRERARLVGGMVEISSGADEGTTVRVGIAV